MQSMDYEHQDEILEQKELTYWEKAVGITFNPGKNPSVNKIKELYAEIIDLLDLARQVSWPWEQWRILSVAITEAQTAQMWAVKWVTWE